MARHNNASLVSQVFRNMIKAVVPSRHRPPIKHGRTHNNPSNNHAPCPSTNSVHQNTLTAQYSSYYIPTSVPHPHRIVLNLFSLPHAAPKMDHTPTPATLATISRININHPNAFDTWVATGFLVNWCLLTIMACGMLSRSAAHMALFSLFFVPVRPPHTFSLRA
jgi:hypothetical protein